MAQEMTWSTVADGTADTAEETKIVFDSVGDEFTGLYLGMRLVEPSDGSSPYKQARFQGMPETDAAAELYFTNANHSLREGLKDVRKGTPVRLTFTDEIDTGQASPMKVFRIETGKLSRNT